MDRNDARSRGGLGTAVRLFNLFGTWAIKVPRIRYLWRRSPRLIFPSGRSEPGGCAHGGIRREAIIPARSNKRNDNPGPARSHSR
jgi:hypothetical protein